MDQNLWAEFLLFCFLLMRLIHHIGDILCKSAHDNVNAMENVMHKPALQRPEYQQFSHKASNKVCSSDWTPAVSNHAMSPLQLMWRAWYCWKSSTVLNWKELWNPNFLLNSFIIFSNRPANDKLILLTNKPYEDIAIPKQQQESGVGHFYDEEGWLLLILWCAIFQGQTAHCHSAHGPQHHSMLCLGLQIEDRFLLGQNSSGKNMIRSDYLQPFKNKLQRPAHQHDSEIKVMVIRGLQPPPPLPPSSLARGPGKWSLKFRRMESFVFYWKSNYQKLYISFSAGTVSDFFQHQSRFQVVYFLSKALAI